MGSDLTRLLDSHPASGDQEHAARLTLAELALDTSDDPHADLALALAVLGLGGRERGLWLEQP